MLFTCVIVLHELCVNENDLYVVVMRCLDAFHVVDSSILWLYIVAKSVLLHSCKLHEMSSL